MIKKRQIKFWSNLNQNTNDDSPLGNLLLKAQTINLPYIRYYQDLVQSYGSPTNCENVLQNEFINNINAKIRDANVTDINSKLGTYLLVNPTLQSPAFPDSLFELERIHITRFRSGAHNLRIETDRYTISKIRRELRICLCGNEIQTLRHVLMDCTIVAQNRGTLENNFTSVSEFFSWNKLHDYLIVISNVLKIEL